MPLDSNAWFERPLDVPLPRGGGQIVDASGQTQTFQFQPPTEEAAAAALHSAAQEERMFNVQRSAAMQEAEDRQFMQDLIQNARTANSARVVDMAMQFQEMRAFERERTMGLAANLSPELATIRALSRHPRAVGGGSAAASMMRAMAPAPQLQQVPVEPGKAILYGDRIAFPPSGMFPGGAELEEQTVGGTTFAVSPKTGAFRRVATEGISSSARVSSLQRQVAALQKRLESGLVKKEDRPGIEAEVARMEGVIRKELSLVEPQKSGSQQTAPETEGVGGVRVRRKSDNKVFIYRGSAADVPTDKYEVLP